MSKRGRQANEAIEAKADEADATNEAVASGVAIDTNAVDDANKAKAYANKADSIEVLEVEAKETNEADSVNKADADDTNKSYGPMIRQGHQFQEIDDAKANKTNEANVSDKVEAN